MLIVSYRLLLHTHPICYMNELGLTVNIFKECQAASSGGPCREVRVGMVSEPTWSAGANRDTYECSHGLQECVRCQSRDLDIHLHLGFLVYLRIQHVRCDMFVCHLLLMKCLVDGRMLSLCLQTEHQHVLR